MSITAIPSSTFTQPQISNASKLLQQNFGQIGQDLAAGNLSAAQQDYAALRQSLQSPADRAVSRGPDHHQFRVGRPTDQNSPEQILTQLGQELASGNLSAAKQAYSSLQALSPLSDLVNQPGARPLVQSTGSSFSA